MANTSTARTSTITGTNTITAIEPLALLRLFHLVSPALPIGAYAYSQGLEYAVQVGWVADEAGTFDWLQGLSRHALGTLDLPILLRLHAAWQANDTPALERWNGELIAARETAELRAEERHLGTALARVLMELEIAEARAWLEQSPAFATMFSLAAVRWRIAPQATLSGYLWAWIENQVLAAIKLVPLGQSAGQRLLHRLTDALPQIVERALTLPEQAIGVSAVSQVMASALHESQYSRLFRS
jgi:urease accessory protein